ncbi:MAG: sterol desaturase family protein, partial [Candidatus Omnitrophica bacterium]|nr:sterol desaturase family protein [Candidatus Omnitrophota bacterium]
RWESLVRLIHITPRLHTAHHTVSRRTRNSNYSTIFTFWDRIFGTLKDATPKEISELGTDEGRRNYLKVSAVPLSVFKRIP